MPEVAEVFAKTGGRIMKLSPPETEALLKRDVERWTKLIQDAGLGGGDVRVARFAALSRLGRPRESSRRRTCRQGAYEGRDPRHGTTSAS